MTVSRHLAGQEINQTEEKTMENYFTSDNTAGFSALQLAEMNEELESRLGFIHMDRNNPNYRRFQKYYSERVFKKYSDAR